MAEKASHGASSQIQYGPLPEDVILEKTSCEFDFKGWPEPVGTMFEPFLHVIDPEYPDEPYWPRTSRGIGTEKYTHGKGYSRAFRDGKY